MKKVLFFLIFAFIGFSLHALDLELTDFSVSMSPTSLLFLPAAENADEDIEDYLTFVGMSANFGVGKVEHDFFISAYPNDLSFGYERRSFLSESKVGIFCGIFTSLDYKKYSLEDGVISIDLTRNLYENCISTLGVRFGYEVGLRIPFNAFSITPKVGLGFPLFYIFENEKANIISWNDYLNIMFLNSIFIGLKIDFPYDLL